MIVLSILLVGSTAFAQTLQSTIITMQHYPQRFASLSIGSSDPAMMPSIPGSASAGCAELPAATHSQVFKVVTSDTRGTYSFHVSTPSGSTWAPNLFLASDYSTFGTTMLCNSAGGYGYTTAIRNTRADLTVTLLGPSTYYLVVSTSAGSGAPFGYTLWAQNDAYPAPDYDDFVQTKSLGLESIDALDALEGSLGLLPTTGAYNGPFYGFLDLNPMQVLDPTVSNHVLVWPTGDGVVNNMDALDALYMSVNLMAIPTGSAECESAAFCASGGVCTIDGTGAGTCNTVTSDTACGSKGGASINCRTLNKYCFNNACEACDANTCPTGCCDANGVCHTDNNSTYCGLGGNTCAYLAPAGAVGCPQYTYLTYANQTSTPVNTTISCINGYCADIAVTFSLSGSDSVCSVAQQLNYVTADVAFAGAYLGTQDAGWNSLYLVVNESTSTVVFEAEGQTAATGPGSYAVLHFNGTASSHSNALASYFTLYNGTGIPSEAPYFDTYSFANCSLPPAGTSPNFSWAATTAVSGASW
jgi:hypothetical protein